MAEYFLAESHELSPHDPLPRDLLPEVVSRPEREASLQITPLSASVGLRFWALLHLSPQVIELLFACLILSLSEMVIFDVGHFRWLGRWSQYIG
jgi:hypothetical protein